MIKNLKNFFRNLTELWSLQHQNSCRICEINTCSQEVVFQVKNIAVFVRYKFSDAIADLNMINNIAPWEACWLGGYFGRALRVDLERGGALKKAKGMSFLLKNQHGLYTLVFETRTGEVGYYDRISKQEFVEHPLTIVRNEHIISKFDSTQACYIGILAGIRMEQAISRDRKTSSNHHLKDLFGRRPYLRIVE